MIRQAQAEIAEFGAKQEGGWRSSAGRTVARPRSQQLIDGGGPENGRDDQGMHEHAQHRHAGDGDGAGERQRPAELGVEPNELKEIAILDYVRVETSSPSKARGPFMWLGSVR